jgi:hypothetical protein
MKETISDGDLFKECIGNLIVETRAGREHLAVRAFGEMVDLLCRDGNHDGATRLDSCGTTLERPTASFLWVPTQLIIFTERYTGGTIKRSAASTDVFALELLSKPSGVTPRGKRSG